MRHFVNIFGSEEKLNVPKSSSGFLAVYIYNTDTVSPQKLVLLVPYMTPKCQRYF